MENPKSLKEVSLDKELENQFIWHNPKKHSFKVNGFAWFQSEKQYRRLPKSPTKKLRVPVDELADCTSGGQIRFKTNAKKLAISVKLMGEAEWGHMSALGQCGFDVYVGEPGKQQYFSSAIPPLNKKIYECVFWDFKNKLTEEKEITINFPLFQGVDEVYIGTNMSAEITPPTEYRTDKKVLIYGTSITQGISASRPGMSYTNILSRRFHCEFFNLGFSGNGKGEREVALTLREISNPGCFVIDYEANVDATEYEATLLPFIKLYREKHPYVPIIIISRILYAKELTIEQSEDFRSRRYISKSTVKKLQLEGDKYITFLDGSKFLGEKWHECTVDGVHPSDYGFMKIADGIEKGLLNSLKQSNIL